MDTSLPLTRVRTIMKSSLNTGQVNNEVLFLMAKSTELFISYLTKQSHLGNDQNLRYEHLAQFVQSQSNLEFLLQILPQKIKVVEFKKILEQTSDSLESSLGSDEE